MQKGSEPSQTPAYRPLANEIDSPRKKIANLTFRRSELHRRNDIAGAIPLQFEIIRLLEQLGASARERANAHNMLSVLYTKNRNLAKAELHARQAIDLDPGGDTPEDHDALACYFMNLARTLALQKRLAEAIPFLEAAIKEWTVVHNPPNDFLRARQEELQSMRVGIWKDT